MKVRWLLRALGDLDHIARYIAEDNPSAASQTILRIRHAVSHIIRAPDIGRKGRVKGTRELILAGTPYIVVYRVRRGLVEILAVLHHARRWPDDD